MRKFAKILLTAGGLALATGAVATPALSDVRFNLSFGAPYYGPYYYTPYYYAPYGYYGYYGYGPYYYRHHYRYYHHW